jgi:hypothetical protein
LAALLDILSPEQKAVLAALLNFPASRTERI